MLFLLLSAWLGGTALLARKHLLDVRSEVSRLQKDVTNGRTDRLNPGLASIRDDAGSAQRLTSDPVWWVASHIPVLGRTFETSSGLAKSADELADGTLPELVNAADQLDPAKVRRSDGSLQLARLTAASPHLERADSALANARASLADLPETGVVGPVANARTELDDQLASLAGSLDGATRAARIGPAMLGENGPRRYLVMFQNPAEARGTGGLAGSFTVMRAENGDLHRERTGSDSDLKDADTPVVDLGPEFNARWRAGDVDRGWRNANATPHYPWAAEIWQKLWEKQTGQPVDGVIAVDPVALGYVLKVTGPVRLSDGEVLTGDNVAQWTLSTEYFKYPDDNERRKELLTELAEKAFDRFSGGDGRSAALLTALGRAAGEHRVLLWSAHPEEQAVIDGTPLAGNVLDESGPFVMPVINNGGGNKLDYYVERTLTREVVRCDSDRRAGARDVHAEEHGTRDRAAQLHRRPLRPAGHSPRREPDPGRDVRHPRRGADRRRGRRTTGEGRRRPGTRTARLRLRRGDPRRAEPDHSSSSTPSRGRRNPWSSRSSRSRSRWPSGWTIPATDRRRSSPR